MEYKIKMGLYNEFGEKIGSVEFDGKFYYNGYLFGYFMFYESTPDDFWNWANKFGLSVGSF